MGGVAASAQPVFLPRLTSSNYAALSAPQYREIIEHLGVSCALSRP